jgi:Flp pilus assembly pilin Flp
MKLVKRIQPFLNDEQGAELAEYAVGVALLVAIGLVVYKVLGEAVNDQQSGTAAKVTGASSSNGF